MAYSIPSPYSIAMVRFVYPFMLLLIAASLAPLGGADASPQRRGEQAGVRHGSQSGELRPFREIVGAARRQMNGASLIGTEFAEDSGIYRLKFMRDGSVIFVEVDGRTAAVISRSDR